MDKSSKKLKFLETLFSLYKILSVAPLTFSGNRNFRLKPKRNLANSKICFYSYYRLCAFSLFESYISFKSMKSCPNEMKLELQHFLT